MSAPKKRRFRLRYIIFLVIAVIIIAAIAKMPESDAKTNSPAAATSGADAAVKRKKDSLRDKAIARIKVLMKRQFPNDYSLRELTINAEIEAYDQMTEIPDSDPIKKNVTRMFPESYSLQHTTYLSELEAKERLENK